MILLFFIIVGLQIPDFKWQDEQVFNNGNDYLVIEEFQGFVTTSDVPPRIVYTKSPYSPIRKLDIRKDVSSDSCTTDTIIYHGKIWHRLKEEK